MYPVLIARRLREWAGILVFGTFSIQCAARHMDISAFVPLQDLGFGRRAARLQGLMFSDCPRKWLLNNSVCQSWAETASRLDAYKRSSRLFGYISAHRFLAGSR